MAKSTALRLEGQLFKHMITCSILRLQIKTFKSKYLIVKLKSQANETPGYQKRSAQLTAP